MSPSAAPHAVRQGSQNDTEMATTGPDARCSPQYVLSAAKTPKYLLNPAVIDRFTVAIATVKSDQADNARLTKGPQAGNPSLWMPVECVDVLCR